MLNLALDLMSLDSIFPTLMIPVNFDNNLNWMGIKPRTKSNNFHQGKKKQNWSVLNAH